MTIPRTTQWRAAAGRFSPVILLTGVALACVFVAVRAATADPALFAQLQAAPAVVEGPPDAAKAVLYVFFDANCFYCHVTWKALAAYERIGLQVHWVPVAYQKDSSFGRAAAILGAHDPLSAFRRNETGYRAASYDGGIPPARVDATLRARLDANTALMKRFGVPATPGLVWKDAAGQVRVSAGVPHEAELAAMTGLPRQAYRDPDLQEFK
jgi:thiol:disulfide interchange protein DsbG